MAIKTVLLIEDNPGDRTIYGNMLWYNGFDVVFAEDGETGYRLAHELKPDLILLDLQLPLLHGSELSSQLKQSDSTKNIPIVVLTARRLVDLGGNSEVLGYERFLEKPISPLEVLRVVEQIIGRAIVDQLENHKRPEVMRARLEDARRAMPKTPSTASAGVQAIAAKVIEHSSEVMELWQKGVTDEPWYLLPREDRAGFLPEVVVSLAEASLLLPNQEESCRKTVVAAAAHGRGRRVQNIPESSLPIEFHLLREAIWRYLMQEFEPSDDLRDAIMAFDSTISLALNACMWGYFRDEIEAQGIWEAAVDRLVGSACVTDEEKLSVAD
jgi:two-component system, cell cycle response regulator DivK